METAWPMVKMFPPLVPKPGAPMHQFRQTATFLTTREVGLFLDRGVGASECRVDQDVLLLGQILVRCAMLLVPMQEY